MHIVFSILLAGLSYRTANKGAPPLFLIPKAHTVDHSWTSTRTKVADTYRWLEDLDSPRTQDWVAEANTTASYSTTH